jgi:mRNA-degrading endonuclease RelE of RelBE toxin-antitoxin system
MKVLLHHPAEKYLARLNATDRNRIVAAIDKLQKDPPEGDIRPIIGQKGFLRAKAGDFRILFKIRENYIFVTNIVPRGQAYNKKEKRK